MNDLVERLRSADMNSQQRALGSPIFGEAAAEITRLRAALTARDERMKAEGAKEAQAKIARLTEALDEKQDGGKDFWMKWTQKRLESRNAMFLRDAKLALAGDMRALRNRVELMEAEPMPIVLSADLQENADE